MSLQAAHVWNREGLEENNRGIKFKKETGWLPKDEE